MPLVERDILPIPLQAHLTGETTPIPKSPLEEDGADVCLDPTGQHRPHILRSGSRLHESAESGLHLYVLRTGAGTEQVCGGIGGHGEMSVMPGTISAPRHHTHAGPVEGPCFPVQVAQRTG